MSVLRTDAGAARRAGSVDGAGARIRRLLRSDSRGGRRSLGRRIRQWFGKGRWIAVLVLFALGVVQALNLGPVEALRNRVFDYYQQIHPRPLPDPLPTAIVDLDEESLAEIGQWPWPRTIVAQLLANLMNLGAVAVGFDMVFAEEDRMSPANFAAASPLVDAETREKLNKLASNDDLFASVLKQSRAVLGHTGYNRATTTRDAVKSPVAERGLVRGISAKDFVPALPGLVRNTAKIEAAAPARGIFTVIPDSDGVVRRVPAVIQVDGILYPSLSAEMLRLAAGRSQVIVVTGQDGVQEVRIAPQLSVPTDSHGRTWVYFTEHDRAARYTSAKDILANTADPARIKGKLVLIGTSAAGLLDIRSTPIHPNLPGVEVHANLLETILAKTNLKRPPDILGREISMALVAGIVMIVFVPMLGAAWSLGMMVVLLGAMGAYSWYEFTGNLTLVDASYPGLAILFMYMLLTYTSYAKTAAERKQVRGAFSQYLSPALLEQLADDPSRLKLGGETKDMTIMFSDIRGFTTISEQFKTDPQGLTTLINRFLTPMTTMILERSGTIDKYMGDAIMAFWNAPMDDPQHAQHACDAALAMFGTLDGINETIRQEAEAAGRKHYPLNCGIGLNSGDVVVGNMGSDQRFDYSVLGDAVNLASRLEGQSKTYGVGVVLGEETRKRAPEYAAVELDLIAVKGKKEAVRIFALLGAPTLAADAAFKALGGKHAAMLVAYRSQDWTGTRALIAECRALDRWNLGELYDLYEERLAQYEADPPGANWDGVFVAKSK